MHWIETSWQVTRNKQPNYVFAVCPITFTSIITPYWRRYEILIAISSLSYLSSARAVHHWFHLTHLQPEGNTTSFWLCCHPSLNFFSLSFIYPISATKSFGVILPALALLSRYLVARGPFSYSMYLLSVFVSIHSMHVHVSVHRIIIGGGSGVGGEAVVWQPEGSPIRSSSFWCCVPSQAG